MAAASGHLALKWRMAVSAGDLDLALILQRTYIIEERKGQGAKPKTV